MISFYFRHGFGSCRLDFRDKQKVINVRIRTLHNDASRYRTPSFKMNRAFAALIALIYTFCSSVGAVGRDAAIKETANLAFGLPARDPGELSRDALGCLLGSARQLIKGVQLPLASPCGIPVAFNARIFLTVFPAAQTEAWPLATSDTPLLPISSALGNSVEEALILSAKNFVPRLPAGPFGAIAIDFAVFADTTGTRHRFNNTIAALCTEGYAFSDLHGGFGFVAPNELCQENLPGVKVIPGDVEALNRVRVDSNEFLARMEQRTGLSSGNVQRNRRRNHRVQSYSKNQTRTFFSFRTRSFVQLVDGTVFEQIRGLRKQEIEVTPTSMLAAVKLGAEYLVRSQMSDGRFTYLWDAIANRDLTGNNYNQLRHSGTIFFLSQAFRYFPRERTFLEASEKAITWLEKQMIPMGKFRGESMSGMCIDKFQQSRQVGCVGIALVGWVEMILRRGGSLERGELEKLRQLGRYIVHQQYKDGHFRKNSDAVREGKAKPNLKEEIEYYQGEAEVGLMRLFELDRDPVWKETSMKGVLWTIVIRDKKKGIKTAPYDHWLMYAVLDLFRYYKEPMLARHAVMIGKGIVYHGLNVTVETVAPRLEALTSILRMARFAPKGMFESRIVTSFEETAKRFAKFLLENQHTASNTYFLPNPKRALGGFRSSPVENVVRDDYEQHAGSALMQLALLGDPTYEKDGARWTTSQLIELLDSELKCN